MSSPTEIELSGPREKDREIFTEWERDALRIRHTTLTTIEGFDDDINTLLIIAGAFSTAVAISIVESHGRLQVDETTRAIAQLLNHSSLRVGGLPSEAFAQMMASSASSHISQMSARALWIISLALSMTATFLTLLCKYWSIGNLSQPSYASPQIKLWSNKTMSAADALGAIPTLLKLAFVLFLSGMALLFWTHGKAFAAILTASVVLGTILLTVLPTLGFNWLVRSPIEWLELLRNQPRS
ncbi:hypothetical protein BDW22DRAFT_1395259 [Trametopsis cervina]|nr:hypothetical protein BDW22DRAFT_1395259 [Trametopsis cervina]